MYLYRNMFMVEWTNYIMSSYKVYNFNNRPTI